MKFWLWSTKLAGTGDTNSLHFVCGGIRARTQVAATETVWPVWSAKPGKWTIWPFTDKRADPRATAPLPLLPEDSEQDVIRKPKMRKIGLLQTYGKGYTCFVPACFLFFFKLLVDFFFFFLRFYFFLFLERGREEERKGEKH